jgi:hypothetical protein
VRRWGWWRLEPVRYPWAGCECVGVCCWLGFVCLCVCVRGFERVLMRRSSQMWIGRCLVCQPSSQFAQRQHQSVSDESVPKTRIVQSFSGQICEGQKRENSENSVFITVVTFLSPTNTQRGKKRPRVPNGGKIKKRKRKRARWVLKILILSAKWHGANVQTPSTVHQGSIKVTLAVHHTHVKTVCTQGNNRHECFCDHSQPTRQQRLTTAKQKVASVYSQYLTCTCPQYL